MSRLPDTTKIIEKIYEVRGHKVMLDADLAEMYGVETKALKQAVRRNPARFPDDFMFILTRLEFQRLRSQFVTSNAETGRGGARALPMAFTEQGVAMLSSVLKSERAIQVNIAIIRVYVQTRALFSGQHEVWKKLQELEKHVVENDDEIKEIFGILEKLLVQEEKPRNPIGFRIPAKE
ncbi:MAG: ORF6N domain-containing protein [Chitinophagaceae bacterium]|uniref:ORF6N domain-containing protein n=1 Tax=Parasegetibacter sp. NRK P23 TaxID=2942999 RepID=UPI0020445924|nr:ORF6N domain-containing protein [Parasegetibacter sp. NRK P23]MCM5527791.1 ORF6N domain-containing protein [Parasegetibacter sp. NRK P23]